MKGSSWTAIAARAAAVDSVVQIQTNARTGLDIFVDLEKQDFEDVATQEFNGKIINILHLNRFNSEYFAICASLVAQNCSPFRPIFNMSLLFVFFIFPASFQYSK